MDDYNVGIGHWTVYYTKLYNHVLLFVGWKYVASFTSLWLVVSKLVELISKSTEGLIFFFMFVVL